MIGVPPRISRKTTAAGEDGRVKLTSEHLAVVEQRAAPAIFVITGQLRVLYYRADPTERRKEFRVTQKGTLPSALEYTVLKLFLQEKEQQGGVRRAALSSSVAVKLIELSGGSAPTYAVLVERFALRDHVESIARRYRLSRRERQVLALIVKGLRTEEVAQHLVIARSTVIFHVKQLLMKTNSRNRTEMVAKIID
jgi:DNA-binding NarL/FixJ family response regulator